MVLIAQSWIKHHPKMFMYLCWFNWSVIKVYTGCSEAVFFLLSIITWACLLGSGLKFIFHWKAQLPIFSKSSLRSLVQVLISWTMENREVSSAKSLHSLLRPSDKSLIYIRNIKGPRSLRNSRTNICPRWALTIQDYSLFSFAKKVS